MALPFLSQKKCKFFQDSIEYCGYVIDADGLHKSPKKVEAILEAPTPTDVSQVRSLTLTGIFDSI